MPKKHVTSPDAPKPIGPYSQGVISGGLLFASGQIAIDPATGQLIEGDVAAQTERVIKNLLAVLKEAKMGPENVVKTTVFLASMADFPKMNEVYERFLGKEPPARSTVEAGGLPQGAEGGVGLFAGVLCRGGRLPCWMRRPPRFRPPPPPPPPAARRASPPRPLTRSWR